MCWWTAVGRKTADNWRLRVSATFPPSWVDRFVIEFVEIGGELETVGQLTAKNDVRRGEPGGVRGRVAVVEEGANDLVLSLIMRLADLRAAYARPLFCGW